MQIAIVSYKFLSGVIKLVKLFFLKILKINLYIFLKIIIFNICNYILIVFIYCIFIKDIKVSYFNIYTIIKKIIRLLNLKL